MMTLTSGVWLKYWRVALSQAVLSRLLFISAPDPFQVNWEIPTRFASWAVRQHYIMWDMDSLIEEVEMRGFKNVYKKRNLDYRWLQDYHLLFKK